MGKTLLEIQAKDNASQVIKEVKQSVESVKESTESLSNASSNLDKIKARFDKITNSAMPARRELRALEQIMSRMNLDGLANTDVFTEIAQRAGTIKDAMLDARQATSAYASDEFKLQAMGEALGGIAAAGSIATGAMGLFGVKNEEVAQTLLKVQSAQAMLNGVTQIAKLLNKDSILMLRLKQIQLAANAASTKTLTVATTVNSTATGANTVSVVASTAAGKAWNVVKAVSKALLGDFTGLILVGATALATYAIATSNSADNQDDFNDSIKKGEEAEKSYKDTIVSTYAQLMTSYSKLQSQWKSLSTEHEKNAWIKENKTNFDNLRLSINNVVDAEKVFNGNTNAVAEAFIKRAKAAAQLAKLTDLYKKQMDIMAEMETLQPKSYGKFGPMGGSSSVNKVEEAAKNFRRKQLQKQLDETNRLINSAIKNIDTDITAPTYNNNKTGGGGNTNTNKPTYLSGSINAMKAELNALQQKLADGLIPKDKEQETIKKISDLKNNIEKEEIRLGFKPEPKVEVQKKIEEHYKDLTIEAIVEPKDIIRGSEDDKRASYSNAQNRASQIQNDVDSGVINIDEANRRISELNQKLQSLGLKPVTIEIESNWDKFRSDAETAMDAIGSVDNVVGSISNLANSISEGANAWDIFMNMASSAMSVIEAINTIMQVSTMFTNLNTASKIANASASAGQSASQEAAQIAGVTQAAASTEQIIANKMLEASVLDLAAAEIFLAHAAIPFAGVGIATGLISTMMAAQAAQHAASLSLQSFANGGIIQGSRTIGDNVLVAANGGEMMLNTMQQNHLFKMIDEGRVYNNTNNGPVVFKIKGKTLEGVQRNYDNKMKKLR